MLKKLSKYGNSTTLVIDKAILELLSMDHSGLVKLETDGKSLIITPASAFNAAQEKVSYSGFEAMQEAVKAQHAKASSQAKPCPPETMIAMQKDFTEVFARHKDVMQKYSEAMMSSAEFQEAMATLAEKYDPTTQSEEYLKEFEVVKARYFPEMAELDKEIKAINEKYGQLASKEEAAC